MLVHLHNKTISFISLRWVLFDEKIFVFFLHNLTGKFVFKVNSKYSEYLWKRYNLQIISKTLLTKTVSGKQFLKPFEEFLRVLCLLHL